MSRRKTDNGSSSWTGLLSRMFGRKTNRQASRRQIARRLRLESLEGRTLMATDLAMIQGRIFRDLNPAGFTAGEQVVGATVELFVDDGDGVFEPGAGDGAPVTDTTDAQGVYSFNGLSAGNYWVRQPAQTVGPVTLQSQVSSLITVTPAQAQGDTGTSIDAFATPGPTITVPTPAGSTSSNTQDDPQALGGERDLHATLTIAGDPSDEVQFRAITGFLDWSATATAEGRYVAIWDGNDNSGSLTPAFNLLNVDLTDGGSSTALQMFVSSTDKPNGTARIRLYSSATNFSESALIVLPQVPASTQEILVPYSSFVVAGGTGVDLTQVRAVELTIEATEPSMQGRLSLFGAIGPTVLTQNFSNPADLSLTKTVNNATPNVGQNVTFTVTVSNAGPNSATNVAVEDILPAGLTFVSSSPSVGTYNSGTGIWTVGNLAVGATATLGVVATVTTPGVKINVAEISFVDQVDPDSTPDNGAVNEDDRGTAQIDTPSIDLNVTKTVNDSTPNVGQNVTFTVTVGNTGTNNATGVSVLDLLPAGLTFVSSNPSVGTYNSGTGVWTVGTINTGASATLQIVATVTTAGVKTNTAQVSAANQFDVDSTPNNNVPTEDDQASAVVTPDTIDLALTKTVNDTTPDRNQNVTYTVTVNNTGAIGATGVVVTDLLPAGLTFVSSTPSVGTYNSGTGVWTIGSIAAGGSATLNVVATVATSTVKTNTAQVTAANEFDVDSTPGNGNAQEDDQASATVTPNIADLSLTKTVNDPTPDKNENVTFTVTLSNAGPAGATNVAVADLLPAGLTFVSANPSQGTYVSGTGVWTVGAVNSGASATLQIVATVATVGVKTNTAQVSAADQFDPDSTPNNNLASEDDQASAAVTPLTVDLSLTKTVNVANPTLNQNVTFTITAANAGPNTATNVTVNDPLPAGLTFVSSTPSAGTYNNATGIWTIGSLNSGASATLQIVATVATVGAKTNTAEVATTDQFDIDSTPGNGANGEDDRASAAITTLSILSKRQFLAE